LQVIVRNWIAEASVGFRGKSQEPPQLAVGTNGKRGFGGGSPHYGFFLGISPGISNGQAHEIR